MSQVHNFSFGAFEWFIGVVEDRDDPKKLGRCRVRAFGYYDGEIPVEDLPWAMVLQSTDSAAKAGVGSAPVGFQVGTHVVGFFADGKNAQTPIIMGSLAGAPEGEPDTNRLTRGEELEQTVVQEKKDSAITSEAAGGIQSGLSAAASLQNKIGAQMSSVKSSMSSVKDSFAAIGDASIMTDLNSISQLVTQIATAPAMAKSLQSQLEGQIASVRGRVDMLKNMDPEAYVKGLAGMQTRDVESSIRALQNLDFDSVLGSLQSIPMAISQVGRLTDSIKAMGDIGNIVSSIKGLSRAIPNIGSITALGRTISLANVWSEPPTPAAPQYPLNKIMETEGGHIQEFDSTPGAERYHQYHPAGTFTEVHPDGTTVDKVVKDNYRVVMGDDYLHVEGNVKVNILGNATVVVNGDATTTVAGNKTDVIKGDYSVAVGGNYSLASGGAINESANAQFAVKALRVDLN